MTDVTDRDRIIVLLECYPDVQPGLVDTDGGTCSRPPSLCPEPDCARFGCIEAASFGLAANGPWKHSSYRQLERLLARMRREEPRLARHLLRRYLSFHEVRRAYCRVCGRTEPPGVLYDERGKLTGAGHVRAIVTGKRIWCRLGGRIVPMLPVVMRFPPEDVSEVAVEDAIDWLCTRWKGAVDLPKELVHHARPRTCATVSGGVVSRLPENRVAR